MQVCLRADASSQLGLGHLRRSLSLAVALRRCSAEVELIVGPSDIDARAIAAAQGCQVLCLPRGTTVADDAPATLAALGARRPEWVVVDHYGLDAHWHDTLREHTGARIAVIDDLADRPLSPDALIDHNLVPGSGGHRARYAPRLRRAPQAWCCGPRFALLSERYEAAPVFRVSEHVNSVGIFMGGTDPAALSAPMLRALRDAGFSGAVEVASTSSNPTLPTLRQAIATDPAASLVLDLPDLCDFFSRHDLQIGAGGGAAWERCSLGAPTLTLAVAANQQAVIPALVGERATATAELSAPAISAALRRLIAGVSERRELSVRSRALVDGRGALRCALALNAARPDAVALRPAARTDAELLWRWRNDPATRAVSRNASEIAWQEHEKWLTRRLATPEPRLWVASVGAVDIGVIRFDRVAEAALEVSLHLDPGLHGLGLGQQLLAAGEREVAGAGAERIHAEVLADNPASARLFASAGYRATGPLNFEKLIGGRVSAAAEERCT